MGAEPVQPKDEDLESEAVTARRLAVMEQIWRLRERILEENDGEPIDVDAVLEELRAGR